MIIITENITNKKIAYAESDNEYLDSLFKPVDIEGAENNRGSLALFYKIQERKTSRLYWISDKGGYFLDKKSNLWGQFSKLESGKLFCQYTLAKITKQ